jgi:gamma-glutamyltranspeptidase
MSAQVSTEPSGHTLGSQDEFSHQPVAWGSRGMVGAGTQLSAQAGMRVLWQGGNTVDAAVAGALAAGVWEPNAHYSLGGEVAFLFFDAAARRVRSAVGQGWAPQQAAIDLYLERWGEIPSGVLSTTVPGVISALSTTLSEYGTISFTQAAQAAVGFAQDRFPASTLERLRDLGHRVEPAGPWGISNGFAPILVDQGSGAYNGGADPRKESVIFGW